jgi:hypothetical protein
VLAVLAIVVALAATTSIPAGSATLGRRAEVRLMDGERTRLSVRYRTRLVP